MAKILVASICTVVLCGCASFFTASTTGSTLCKIAQEHCVQVTIHGDTIAVDQSTVYVTGRGPKHWIVWYIDTPGYQFVNVPGNRPINFKTSNDQFDPNDSMRCYGFDSLQKVFVCVDKNTAMGSYGYSIKVTGSPTVKVLDPIIVNN